MKSKNECQKCNMSHKDPIFWDIHQTMSDNHVWCINKEYDKNE
jgi:hypothetical protein